MYILRFVCFSSCAIAVKKLHIVEVKGQNKCLLPIPDRKCGCQLERLSTMSSHRSVNIALHSQTSVQNEIALLPCDSLSLHIPEKCSACGSSYSKGLRAYCAVHANELCKSQAHRLNQTNVLCILRPNVKK